MTEVLFALGALLAFGLLAFGAAWLMAAWIGARPVWSRNKKRGRR